MAKLAITKRKVSGGVVAFIGYLLSPLSWWNDAFVNLPLALLFAWTVGLFCRFSKPGFEATVVLGYWLTNVAGFVLLQKGGAKMLSEKDRPYTWRSLARDVAVSLLYTLLIVALVQWGVLQPLQARPTNAGSPSTPKVSQS
jgi:hypothetical protein